MALSSHGQHRQDIQANRLTMLGTWKHIFPKFQIKLKIQINEYLVECLQL